MSVDSWGTEVASSPKRMTGHGILPLTWTNKPENTRTSTHSKKVGKQVGDTLELVLSLENRGQHAVRSEETLGSAV